LFVKEKTLVCLSRWGDVRTGAHGGGRFGKLAGAEPMVRALRRAKIGGWESDSPREEDVLYGGKFEGVISVSLK
jgi:hypothetical protein